MPFDLKPNTRENYPQERPRPEPAFEPDANLHDADETQANAERQSTVGKILHSWRAPEFEIYEKSARWYVLATVFILAMVAYALFTDAPIMAITFILIGIVGYIYSQKDPRVVTFSITSKGVLADKEFYSYENIRSFWIFYDPNRTRAISLHTKASMLPFVHIPISDEDPVLLRKILLEEIPEIKQDPSLINTIEQVFHL